MAAINYLCQGTWQTQQQVTRKENRTLIKSSDCLPIFVDGAQVPLLSTLDASDMACELLFPEDRAMLHSPLNLSAQSSAQYLTQL